MDEAIAVRELLTSGANKIDRLRGDIAIDIYGNVEGSTITVGDGS